MFDSIMWKYMKEEKDLLLELLNQDYKELDLDTLYVVAHGSSYNAASAVAPFISKYAGIRVYVYTPSSFKYNVHSIDFENKEKTWVLGISQTGTSRGVLEALEGIKEKGYRILAITNEKKSPIDVLSDQTYFLNCGIENSNAKTKGYSSTLVVLLCLGMYWAYSKNSISEIVFEKMKEELRNQIAEIPGVIEQTINWCKEHNYGNGMSNIYVIGNGMNFATAMEGQLKLMETQCIPTMFNDVVEFSHGMHRSLNENSFVLLINDGVDKDLMNKTFDYCHLKKYNVCMIDALNRVDADIINVKNFEFTHSILLMTSVIQAISAFVPENNGMDPNRDANNDYTDWMETRV